MSFDYAKMQATAKRLLKRFGKSITVIVLTGKPYDAATRTNTPVYTDSIGYGVKTNFNNSEIDGSLILSSDIKLIIENLDLRPVIDSLVTLSGVEYRVSSVGVVEPADINLVYVLGLRK